jgi:Uma2 family endonuclease
MANAARNLLIATEGVRGLQRPEYEALVARGAFDDERVELLEGVIVHMSPHGPLHDGTLDMLVERLGSLSDRAKLRVQSAFAASDGSQPEPDLALVERRDHRTSHPNAAFLIIEIADTSLDRDSKIKPAIYARCGVPEYWVVDLVHSVLIVFREPGEEGYGSMATLRRGDSVALLAFPDVVLRVGDLF